MTTFVKFIEINDHEGETWRFYLQVDGNEKALEELKKRIAAEIKYDEYTLTDERLTESDVDVLVRHSDCGYMDYENKVTGTLVLPYEKGVTIDEVLYKGGIRDLFT